MACLPLYPSLEHLKVQCRGTSPFEGLGDIHPAALLHHTSYLSPQSTSTPGEHVRCFAGIQPQCCSASVAVSPGCEESENPLACDEGRLGKKHNNGLGHESARGGADQSPNAFLTSSSSSLAVWCLSPSSPDFQEADNGDCGGCGTEQMVASKRHADDFDGLGGLGN